MAAKPVPPQPNPCCAALQLRYRKIEEKRNALRQGCHILKDQLSRLEADNAALRKAYDEERAQADNERKSIEKETAFRMSLESKVVDLESQLFSLQQAGSYQYEKELLVLQGKISEKEADVERLKQLLEVETRRTDAERENVKMERQKVMELNGALEAQSNRVKEIADENGRKFAEEQAYVSNLKKQLEEVTIKLKSLEKENLGLKSNQESDVAHFAMQISEKETELDQFRNLLEVEKSRVSTLQETLELEKNKSLKTSDLTQDEGKKAKEGLLEMEILNEVEKLTSKQSEHEDMSKKYEMEKQKVLRERKRADAEKVKAVELKKLAQEHEKKIMEEKSNSEWLLQQVKEERENVETLKQKIQELLLCDKSSTTVQSDYTKLKEAYLNLETENRKLVKEKKKRDRVKAQELKRLPEQTDKKAMEENLNSKQLAHQMDTERQKAAMLQKQVQELLSSANSTAAGPSAYLELKEAHVRLGAQNRMLIKEKKCIEAEMSEVDDIRKLSEANGVKYFEEKQRADNSSQELEMSKQKIKKLEEELCSLKLSRKLVGDPSTVPDVNISTPILLLEQLKLEKKRRKHSKQVLKLEKDRNYVLQHNLGKLKQDLFQTVQHLDMLEKTFCGGTPMVDKYSKSSNLSKLGSLYLKEMLFNSNQFETLEDGFVVPVSSARKESASANPTAVYPQLGNSTESPSGVATNLHPLVGSRVRKISPSSPMDSSAASFPDKMLFGRSQQHRAGSIPTSNIVLEGNPNLKATSIKHSDQIGIRKNRALIASVVDNHAQAPLISLCAHRDKKRKPSHELESHKHMQSESRKLHQELEGKLSKKHGKMNRLMPREVEYAQVLLPDRIHGPRKKRKTSLNPQETPNRSHLLDKGGKLIAPTPPPSINEGGKAQACIDNLCDQDTLLLFEQQILGNVMTLLELDNEDDEFFFRIGIKNPESPDLPDVDKYSNYKFCDPGACSFGQGTYNRVDMERKKRNGTVNSFQQVGGTQILSALVPTSECAKQTERCKSRFAVETILPFCILFSYMEEISRISALLFATKRCLTLCSLHSQTDRILIELLKTLASEQHLTPREKVSVFFTVAMYNFCQVSSYESEVYARNQGSSCSFLLHLCSALSDAKKRGTLEKSFCYRDFLCLFEDFVSQRRMFFCGDKYKDENDFSPRFDIALEGKKVVLYEKTASSAEVFAGSIIFSAICSAVGQISVLCDVSFNVFQLCSADPRHILYILHGFALVCGRKYFLTSNHNIQMEVVKSMVNVLENSRDFQGATLQQCDRKTSHQFPVCDTCPFAKSLQPLDLLSMLVEGLGKYASMPIHALDSSSSLIGPSYPSNKEIYTCIDIMSSVELISLTMGWSWTADKVLPELLKLLPLQSFTQGDLSTSLVILLGRLGRFGVQSSGYEAEGVKSMRQHLSSLLCQNPQNHKVALALFSALDGISLQDEESTVNKQDCPTDISAFSTLIRNCHSSLRSEQKGLISALKQATSR